MKNNKRSECYDEQFEDCFEEFPVKNEGGVVGYSERDDEFEDCLDYFIIDDKRISHYLGRRDEVTCFRSAQVCVKSTSGSISEERERERDCNKQEAEYVNGTDCDDVTDTTSGRNVYTIRELPCDDKSTFREEKGVHCTSNKDKKCLIEKAARDIRGSSARYSKMLVFVCYLPMTTGTTSSNIEWTMASMPAVLGENLTLTCNIPNKVNSLLWHREPDELLAIENYPSDRNKFEITTSEIGNITQYNLTIINLDISDIDRWYRCSNGNDWKEKMLNFTKDGLISKPSDKDITKEIRTENGVQIVSMTIDKIFPLPVCELHVMQKSSTILHEEILSEDKGRFKLKYNFEIQPCAKQVTLLCMLVKERVVQEFLAGKGTSDECSEADHDITNRLMLTFLGSVIGLIIIMTVTFVFWRKRRGRIQYRETSQNGEDTEDITPGVVESPYSHGNTELTLL